MLERFLIKGSEVENLLCGAPSCSEGCLLFSDDLLRLRLQSVQYDLKHDFAWMVDEADHMVFLENFSPIRKRSRLLQLGRFSTH